MRERARLEAIGRDDRLPSSDAQFAGDVRYYLSLEPRQLPSRYFYDALGSALFEAICALPWYPITRAETRLLAAHARAIAAAGPFSTIVELGPGSGDKMRTLLAAGGVDDDTKVHLVDVSASALTAAANALDTVAPDDIILHQATYEAGLGDVAADRAREGRGGAALTLFLGSNIGNFDPPGADAFLRLVRASLEAGDALLLGADLVKPPSELVLAYDDPLGVTAAFNRNLLVRINRELGGDFDLDAFGHHAVWNAESSRVEMHLVSRKRQDVAVELSHLAFSIDEGETIWTESSYKYEPAEIVRRLARVGFSLEQQWVDARDRFALTLVRAA